MSKYLYDDSLSSDCWVANRGNCSNGAKVVLPEEPGTEVRTKNGSWMETVMTVTLHFAKQKTPIKLALENFGIVQRHVQIEKTEQNSKRFVDKSYCQITDICSLY